MQNFQQKNTEAKSFTNSRESDIGNIHVRYKRNKYKGLLTIDGVTKQNTFFLIQAQNLLDHTTDNWLILRGQFALTQLKHTFHEVNINVTD